MNPEDFSLDPEMFQETQLEPAIVKLVWEPDQEGLASRLAEMQIDIHLPTIYYSQSELFKNRKSHGIVFNDDLIKQYRVIDKGQTVIIDITPNEGNPFWVSLGEDTLIDETGMLKDYIVVVDKPSLDFIS